MRPDHLLLVWAATYAAEYVESARRATYAEASSWAASAADRAVYELQSRGRTPAIEGYEKL